MRERKKERGRNTAVDCRAVSVQRLYCLYVPPVGSWSAVRVNRWIEGRERSRGSEEVDGEMAL